jgi:hypothetical protein
MTNSASHGIINQPRTTPRKPSPGTAIQKNPRKPDQDASTAKDPPAAYFAHRLAIKPPLPFVFSINFPKPSHTASCAIFSSFTMIHQHSTLITSITQHLPSSAFSSGAASAAAPPPTPGKKATGTGKEWSIVAPIAHAMPRMCAGMETSGYRDLKDAMRALKAARVVRELERGAMMRIVGFRKWI